MKVLILYLAILITIIVIIPFTLCGINDDGTMDEGVMTIELYNHMNNTVQKIDLENYIVGVVCAEMPAEFNLEALKAQAVAARTYAVRKIILSPGEHPKGDLCTDFAHCQAYISREETKVKWGSDYSKYMSKITQAVSSTKGKYLSYKNEPVMAVFHSCSNGITENSSDVWGGNVPYLVNVSSEGDFLKKDYISTLKVNYDEFVKILNDYFENDININNEPIGNIEYSTGGNVLSAVLFGMNISGTEIRRIYSLKSTSFDLDYTGSEFIFTVYGSGHGVGMSQYGANMMASNGDTYESILYHYYPGTNIIQLNKMD